MLGRALLTGSIAVCVAGPTGFAAAPEPRGFAPAWSVDDEPGALGWHVADADATTVLIDRYGEHGDALVVVDVATGAVRARFDGTLGVWLAGAYGRASFDVRPRLVAPGRALVWDGDKDAALVDLADGHVIWRAPFHCGFAPTTVDRAVAGMVVTMNASGGVWAYDLIDGHERWRSDLRPSVDSRLVVGASELYGLGADGALHALGLEDGRERWRVAWPDDRWGYWQAAASGTHVALASRTMLVLDAADGRELARERAGARRYAGVMVADAGIVVRSGFARDVDAYRLDGEGRISRIWHSRDALGELELDDDFVYGCGLGNDLRVLDRASGEERWSFGLGACNERWPFERRRWRIAANDAAAGGSRVVVDDGRGVTAFALVDGDAPSAAAERATIVGVARVDGKSQSGMHVRVGDRIALTDERGRFALKVSARGSVFVALERDEVGRLSPRPCPAEAERVIALDGRGRYRVDLDGRGYGYECDRACHCD